MQPLIGLTESISWNRAYLNSFNAEMSEAGGIITPIPPCYFEFSSHGLVISIENQNAPPHWFLGGNVTVVAPRINTGSTTVINRNVSIVREVIQLGRPTLIRIPYFGIPPYGCSVTFPRWHSAILIEAWWLDDDRVDPVSELIKDVKDHLNNG